MKKKITRLLAVAFSIVVFALPSCEFIEDCGTCTMYTEYSDGSVTEGVPIVLCGDSYWEKANSTPVDIAGIVTYWECVQ